MRYRVEGVNQGFGLLVVIYFCCRDDSYKCYCCC